MKSFAKLPSLFAIMGLGLGWALIAPDATLQRLEQSITVEFG